jgi:hypothetical protein
VNGAVKQETSDIRLLLSNKESPFPLNVKKKALKVLKSVKNKPLNVVKNDNF